MIHDHKELINNSNFQLLKFFHTTIIIKRSKVLNLINRYNNPQQYFFSIFQFCKIFCHQPHAHYIFSRLISIFILSSCLLENNSTHILRIYIYLPTFQHNTINTCVVSKQSISDNNSYCIVNENALTIQRYGTRS